LAEGKKRDVPIMIWYPIDDSGTSSPLKLIKRRDLDSLKKFVLYQIIPDEFCDVLTNSYEDVLITDKVRKLPVLIFSHGLTATMDSYTILMEYMASHGYIVVSVGHPYDGVASYPDGRSIPIDVKKYNEFFERSRSEEEDKKSKEYLAQIQREDISVEEMKKLTEKDLLGSELDDQIEVWIDDVLFIKDILIRMNGGKIESQFKGKMDLEEGIGVFGHSYGGLRQHYPAVWMIVSNTLLIWMEVCMGDLKTGLILTNPRCSCIVKKLRG
jgi:predicted dienelactone hydrolase